MYMPGLRFKKSINFPTGQKLHNLNPNPTIHNPNLLHLPQKLGRQQSHNLPKIQKPTNIPMYVHKREQILQLRDLLIQHSDHIVHDFFFLICTEFL